MSSAAAPISDFPYRICNTSPGAYHLAPSVKPLGAGKFCFTIRVADRSCAGACCAADLKKIEVGLTVLNFWDPAPAERMVINQDANCGKK